MNWYFYAPEETSGGILKLHRLFVILFVHVCACIHNKSCLSYNFKTTETSLMKLHRKIKHIEKVSPA